MLAPVSLHVVLKASAANGFSPEQDGAMLAPVSLHVVLKATGRTGFCLINDVLFCQGLPPLRLKVFLLEESFIQKTVSWYSLSGCL